MSTKMPTVAFQGEHGAYSEEAALKYYKDEISVIPYPTFESVFESVESQKCDWGIIPIENSTIGNIHQNYDLLLKSNLYIVGEITLPINHCLISYEKRRISDIEYIYSHPAALAQCSKFLDEHPGIKSVYSYDTAGSVMMLKKNETANTATIASEYAARIYELAVLKRSIQNSKSNRTRFFLLGRRLIQYKNDARTLIACLMKRTSINLGEMISIFTTYDIPITSFQSWVASTGKQDNYYLVEFKGMISKRNVKYLINELEKVTRSLRILGSY